jgi:hypothetical protein
MKKVQKTNSAEQMPDNEVNDNLIEYPLYPDSEDIYNKFKKEKNIDPEDITKTKNSGKSVIFPANSEKGSVDASGWNLDIPGSELDDEQEKIGSEDEENNYYSLGGDDHNNLDEDKDEL